MLLIDQDIGEGFSGGPVLRGGKVVGVITDTDEQTTYAVNALVAREALEGWWEILGREPKPPAMKTCIPGETISENRIEFVRICPGTFTMGSAKNDHPQVEPDEIPAHQVTLTSEFWIGKTEITNEQYRLFQPNYQGEARLPANVTWTEAQAACEYLGGRLPTEAEWEYAARADSQTVWSFGSDESRLDDYAWYDKNADYTPHLVATRKPNKWGLHDMHGNVWEWMSDWHAPYEKGPQNDPSGPKTGEYRVLRGGSFIDSAWNLRSAGRGRGGPMLRSADVGFRCVRGPRRQPHAR